MINFEEWKISDEKIVSRVKGQGTNNVKQFRSFGSRKRYRFMSAQVLLRSWNAKTIGTDFRDIPTA